jgi:hypothetical protein
MKITSFISISLTVTCFTDFTCAAISVLNFNSPLGTSGAGTTGSIGGAPTGVIVNASTAVFGDALTGGQSWTLTGAYAVDANLATLNERVRVSQVTSNNHGFRLENTSPYINNDRVGATFSFAQATPISISAGLSLFNRSAFSSNITTSDTITLTANSGVTWNVRSSSNFNFNLISNIGNIITFSGTANDPSTAFARFDIRSSSNLTSFVVEQTTTNNSTSVTQVNSSQFMIALVPEPSHSVLLLLSGSLLAFKRHRRIS